MKYYLWSLLIIMSLITASCNTCNRKQSHDNPVNSDSAKAAELVSGLQQQVKNNPDSAGLRLKLVYALDSLGNYWEAISQVDSLVGKDSGNYGLWFTKAHLLEAAGDTTKAMETYDKAIRIYPSPDAMLAIANLYAEQKNPRSLLICNKVKDMRLGREFDAHCAFIAGIYNARTGNRDLAIKLFDECIANNYTYMVAYIEKGLVYFDNKQYDKALEVFKFSSSVNNLYADSYYYMARAYEMMNEKDSAIFRYKQALSLDNNLREAKAGIERLETK